MREKFRQILYKGQCIDSDDPMRLGRIRAILKTDNVTNTEESNTYVPWSYNDPFVFLPLLPFFINTPPKNDEFVHLIYSNLDQKMSKDKYYIGGVYSSPTTSNKETYDSAVTNLEEGSRNKKFQDIKYNISSQGVYAEPEDISIYGRGSSDIIIKDNSVILRAGKNKKFNRKKLPEKNLKRSFLQLSKFDQKTSYQSPEKKIRLQYDETPLNKLVEYTLTNPENTLDVFSGYIYIYNLTQDVIAKDNMLDTKIDGITSPISTISFFALSMSDTTSFINDVIKGLHKGDISDLFDDTTYNKTISGSQKFGSRVPLYYRPVFILYEQQKTTQNPAVRENIMRLMSGIKPVATQVGNGHGLIFNKEKDTLVPLKPKTETFVPKKTERFDKSVNIMGSDEIYLLSYESQKTGTNSKIDFENTLYGIDENKVADEIEPKTSSLVRGEELFELIDLIVKFLVSHVHAFPGEAPIPIGTNGSNVNDILKELQNASEKVLNKKIRIN